MSERRSRSRSRERKPAWLRLLPLLIVVIALWSGLKHQLAEFANPQTREQIGDYEVLRGSTLVEDRGNDGDSFLIQHQGETIHLRLYFVDTCEKYMNPDLESQADRVRKQAAYFQIEPEEAVKMGKEAQSFVLDLLREAPFTVYTSRESVYGSERVYGFVGIDTPEDGEALLNEILVLAGLARIHTLGRTTPDGQDWRSWKDHLLSLEEEAIREGAGAWGL